jgi:hypothetical protein
MADGPGPADKQRRLFPRWFRFPDGGLRATPNILGRVRRKSKFALDTVTMTFLGPGDADVGKAKNPNAIIHVSIASLPMLKPLDQDDKMADLSMITMSWRHHLGLHLKKYPGKLQ